MTASTSPLSTLLEPLQTDLQIAQGALRRFVQDGRITTENISGDLCADLRDGLHRLRVDAEIAQGELDAALAYDRRSYLAATRRIVDGWRSRLDALRVQLELGRMDSRDEAQQVLTAGERSWSVASKYLADAESDAEATLDAVRTGLDEALGELGKAARAVTDMLRGRASA